MSLTHINCNSVLSHTKYTTVMDVKILSSLSRSMMSYLITNKAGQKKETRTFTSKDGSPAYFKSSIFMTQSHYTDLFTFC